MSFLSLDSLSLAGDDSPSPEESSLEGVLDRKETAAGVYLRACRKLRVVPVSYFLRNLGTATMNLNHHGLGPLGGKALAIALETDTNITHLELADNYLLGEGARYIVEMLKANFTIHHLDLSDNHLQSEGAECVAKTLINNITIKSIKLSGNGFKESDAKAFAEALSKNYRVKKLDLSHNQFCGRAGEHLAQMLANNEGLEVLDLSWNHLQMKGAVAFCAGLGLNDTLKHLDLSWNGFGNEGALALGEALKFNNTLEHLDLTNNRISNEGLGQLCRGLEANITLRVLKLLLNPLTVEGALALLTAVKKNRQTALEEIDISNVLVNEHFVQVLEQTCLVHPCLVVGYGGVGGFIAKKPPTRLDPMKVIQDYLTEQKLRLLDFFRNIDKDGTMIVSVDDFRNAVQQSDIPLERYQIEELIQKLDCDQTGTMNYRGLAVNRKQMILDHRQHLRHVESRQRKEKQKDERILKTFQSAMEANSPPTSLIMSPGGPQMDSSGPSGLVPTPLSSWHHSILTNSSYSINNLTGSWVRRSTPGMSTRQKSSSSATMSYYSQVNLLDDNPALSTPSSAPGILSDVDHTKLSPTSKQLIRHRPALITKQPATKTRTTTVKRKSKKPDGPTCGKQNQTRPKKVISALSQ